MSHSEKVKLPLNILSNLYKNVLIEAHSTKDELDNNNLEAIFVIQENETDDHDATEELLKGILSACKLNSKNSSVLKSDSSHSETISSVKEKFTPKAIVLFGVSPGAFGLPVTFPHFQIQEINGIKYVSSPDLKELLANKISKQQLWNSLKQIFT